MAPPDEARGNWSAPDDYRMVLDRLQHYRGLERDDSMYEPEIQAVLKNHDPARITAVFTRQLAIAKSMRTILDIANDIRSLSDFKRNTSELLDARAPSEAIPD